jgi:hypothetical protein
VLARLIDSILNRAKTTSFHCDDRTAAMITLLTLMLVIDAP